MLAARTTISPHILNSGEFFLNDGLEHFVSGDLSFKRDHGDLCSYRGGYQYRGDTAQPDGQVSPWTDYFTGQIVDFMVVEINIYNIVCRAPDLLKQQKVDLIQVDMKLMNSMR